jgi:phosphinothricin acetyltransferase
MPIIRPANSGDLKAITAIYNEAVLTTDATFDTEERTLAEQRTWFNQHDERHPIMVAELDEIIVGWASLSEWSIRTAYRDTAEVSIYIKGDFRNQGIGGMLLDHILITGQKLGLHVVIARITGGNEQSIYFHEKAGFEHIGVMKEVGNKSNRLLDVYLMQKIYR